MKFLGVNFIAINYNRVIETWWDDNYKKYYYARRPENKNVSPGDLTDVLEVKGLFLFFFNRRSTLVNLNYINEFLKFTKVFQVKKNQPKAYFYFS